MRRALWLGCVALALCRCTPAGVGTSPSVTSQVTAGSWMDPAARGQDVLYVSLADLNNHVVLAYSYRTQKLLGTLSEFKYPQALCVDTNENLYVTDNARQQISEVPHGGTTPIKVLVDPDGYPLGCAIDPRTGDLAVANFESDSSLRDGNVAIYHRAKGIPKVYVSPDIRYYWFPVYDDAGNLYVNGMNASGAVNVAELPSGAKTFHTLALDQTITYPAGMFWNGQYLAVGDQSAEAVYEFAISNFHGTLEETTDVSNADNLFEFWISPAGHTLVGAAYGDGHGNYSTVDYWKYPQGGSPTHTISSVPYASGVVVSLATPQHSRKR